MHYQWFSSWSLGISAMGHALRFFRSSWSYDPQGALEDHGGLLSRGDGSSERKPQEKPEDNFMGFTSGNDSHSYWKWSFIVSLGMKNGDFHSYFDLPEGIRDDELTHGRESVNFHIPRLLYWLDVVQVGVMEGNHPKTRKCSKAMGPWPLVMKQCQPPGWCFGSFSIFPYIGNSNIYWKNSNIP